VNIVSRKKKGKQTKEKRTDRTAVYLCRCGSNIADTIDIDSLRARYESKGISVVEVNEHLCSEQGVFDLIDSIKKGKVDKAVIAACSPLLHRELFSDAVRDAGLNPGNLHMANIREQCSWVHYDDPEAATAKAAAIIDTGLAEVGESYPITTHDIPVTQNALVIGGGVAGLTTALELADSGISTVVVEREGFLGGHMAKWDKLFPTFDCGICILGPLMARVARHPNIQTLLLTDIIDVRGAVGHYKVTLRKRPRYVDLESCTGCNKCIEVCPVEVADEYNYGLGKRKAMVRPLLDLVPLAPYIDMQNCVMCQSCAGVCEPKSLRYEEEASTETITVGAIVAATGFMPFDPRIVEEFGYGENPDVITSLELERLLNPSGPSGGKLVKPSNGEVPKRIVFVPCVGSRSERFGRPYCSRVCCTASVKEVVQIRQQIPDAEAYVFHSDMRTFGKGHEELQVRAAGEYRVNFIRGTVGEVVLDPVTGQTSIRAEDTMLRRQLELDVDLVVLMVGMDAEPSNVALSRLLKVPLDENGFFLEQHPKLGPSTTVTKGVFLSGVAQGPKDISDTVAHAGLAASKVKTLLNSGTVITEACVPSFDPSLCISCRLCEQNCTPDAITFNDDKHPSINMAACRGCGSCAAACPSGALNLPCLTNEQLLSATKAAVESNPLKPAIVGYLCRWCAYGAADRAGIARITYPPNMIAIQVPCTGRLNVETVMTAFAEGADGVAVMGCHIQDCHYRSGARYAQNRMSKIRELLRAAGIDGGRLYFGSASASEADSFAEQVTRFVNRVTRMGPLGREMMDKPVVTPVPDVKEAVGG